MEKLEEITLKQFLTINQRKISEVQEKTAYLFEKIKQISKTTQDVLGLHDEGYDLRFYYNKEKDLLSYKVVK